MRGKRRIVSRFEDKPAVSVYNAFVKALLKLLLVFLPQSLFHIGKYWDNPLTGLGLWSSNGKSASTVKELSVYQGVVYLDNVLLEIAVLLSEAECLADTAPGSEHYRDKRKPMLVLVRLRRKVYEQLLFSCGQGVTLRLFPSVAFFDFCHNAIGGVCADISITNRRRENRMEQGRHDFHSRYAGHFPRSRPTQRRGRYFGHLRAAYPNILHHQDFQR